MSKQQIVPNALPGTPTTIAVTGNYQASESDSKLVVQTAGVVVTLPANPQVGSTLLEISAEQAFTLRGGARAIFGQDPMAVAAGAVTYCAFTAVGWLVSASSQAGGSTFVYRPNEPNPGGNVFASWSALDAARALVAGPVTIQVDDSLLSPAPVPAGAWDIGSDLTLVGIGSSADEFASLEFEQGATLRVPPGSTPILRLDGVEVQSVSTNPVVTVQGDLLLFTNQASINVTANPAPFFSIPSGGLLAVSQYGGNLGDNDHALFNVGVGGTFVYFGGLAADLEREAVGGLGAGVGASGSYTSDCNVHVATQLGTWTMESRANAMSYAAQTLANWSNVAPTSVADALDRIAAHVGPIP